MAHHPHRVGLDADLLVADLLHHRAGDFVGAAAPGVHHLVVAFAGGDQPVLVLLFELLHLGLRLEDHLLLFGRDDEIVLAEGDAGARGLAEAEAHKAVGEDHALFLAAMAVDRVDHVGDVLLGQLPVDQRERHLRIARQDLRDQHAPGRGGHHGADRLVIRVHREVARADLAVQRDGAGMQRMLDIADRAEGRRLVIRRGAEFRRLQRQVIDAQHDVLARHDDRLAVRRAEDVVRRHHQHPRLELRFQAERHVHRHLVAVEVGIEGRADQRMQLDRLAFDQHRLEGLDAEAVQGRRAVEHHGMLADDLFQDVPHFGTLLLDHPFCRLDGGGVAVLLQLGVDERLEQLERHLLRQAALVQFQFGADDDDGAAGVVDALAQQVLAEAALLALQHVGQRLQRALVGPCDGAAAAAVIEQRVHALLQHALFVAHDDIGRAEFDQPLQPVVPVDHPAIEIVQIARRKPPAIQRHQRTQLRRNHRHHVQDHPLRLRPGLAERLDQFEALDQLLALRLARGLLEVGAQLHLLRIAIDADQDLLDRLGADASLERVIAELVLLGEQLVLGQKLMQLHVGEARLQHDIALEIQNLLELFQRQIDHQPDAARQRLEEPDMGDGRGQLDMPHPFAPHLGERDFDAAFLADDPTELHPLVLAAQALIVLDRPEDARTEQPVALRLEGAVVDRLRLLDLAVGPAADLRGGGDLDLDLVEGHGLAGLTENLHQFIHAIVTLRGAPGDDPGGRIEKGTSHPVQNQAALLSRSTFRPSALSSLTSTLKLSGMPASKLSCSRTMAS